MFIVKIEKENQILAVEHYHHFQNALADIIDYSIFEKISEDISDSFDEGWGLPRISSHSIDDSTGIADDFEFKYPCGILIYLGEVCPADRSK